MSSHNGDIDQIYKGGFLTAHIAGEPYGEMEPSFVHQFWHELGRDLIVYDRDHRTCTVKFNKSSVHPLIVDGWIEMRDTFGITGNKLILLTYVGNNYFIIDVVPNEESVMTLPSYHSYNYFLDDPVSFDVILTNYNMTSSHLNLKKEFADYVSKTGYDKVLLYGPQGDHYECRIMKTKIGNVERVRIGKIWKTFLRSNNFDAGDVLKFKFINKERSNIVKVVKKNVLYRLML